MGNKKDTLITVTVDTENINNGNIDECVTFSDDRNDTPQKPGKPGDYVSTVDKDKNVTWVGVSVNGTDTVSISTVNRKKSGGGAEIMKHADNSSKGDGKVEAKIKDKHVTGEELYDLTFQINGDVTYPVDPKLKMSSEG